MPTYLEPLSGLSQSAALAEAAVAAPAYRAILSAFEMWHPSLAQPVRVVADHQPLLATLEADAPRNADEEVLFMASNVSVRRPTESDAAASPEVELRIDNVTGFISDALDAARESADPAVRDAPWQLIERLYASDDTTAPHRLPVFKVTPIRVSTAGPTAIFTAAYRDSANVGVPAISFTPEAYPGLLT